MAAGRTGRARRTPATRGVAAGARSSATGMATADRATALGSATTATTAVAARRTRRMGWRAERVGFLARPDLDSALIDAFVTTTAAALMFSAAAVSSWVKL